MPPTASGAVALSNNAPPNDKNNPPPEGLHWGDGELKAPRRQRANTPDVKGLFTDSVIARLPEVQVEEDAVASLFGNETRPAPSLTPPAAQQRPNAFWHEPGNTLQTDPPAAFTKSSKARQPTAAAQAALAAAATQQRTAAADPSAAPDSRTRSVTMLGAAPPAPPAPWADQPKRKLPAGALGGAPIGPDGLAIPIVRAKLQRTSLPAGALREGKKQHAAEPVVDSRAAQAEAAAQGTRTFETDNAPSGLDLDIPAANTNSLKPSLQGTPASAPSLRARPGISAVVDRTSLQPKSAPAGSEAMSNPSLRASGALGTSSIRSSGAASPQSAVASAPALTSMRAASASSASDADAGISLRPETAAESSSFPPASDGQRPKSSKERRAEARRAARRKAAKHLPPPPSNTSKQVWDPARIILAAFAGVLSIGAAGLGAAEAGWWDLPPRAAAMLGIGNAQASLANAEHGRNPHLVMPADSANAAPQAPQPTAANERRAPAAISPAAPDTAAAVAADPSGATTAPSSAAPVGAEPNAIEPKPPSSVGPSNPTSAPENTAAPAPVTAPPAVSAATANAPAAIAAAAAPLTASAPQPTAGPNTPAPASPNPPVTPRVVKTNPPPGAAALYSSASSAWSMVPAEEAPAPLAPPGLELATTRATAVPQPTAAASSSATAQPRAPLTISAARAVPTAIGAAASPQPAPAPQPSAAAAQLAASPTPSAMHPANAGTALDESDADESATGTSGDRAVAQKLVALARQKLRSRDAKGAADLMLRQVTNDPEDHHAMEVLVRAWIAMGRGDDAVGYAELIVKKRPRRAAYRVLEGDARLSAGDAAGAQVAWRVALQLEPDNIEAKRRLGVP